MVFWILNAWRLRKFYNLFLNRYSHRLFLYKKKIVYLKFIVYIIFDFKFVLNLAFVKRYNSRMWFFFLIVSSCLLWFL